MYDTVFKPNKTSEENMFKEDSYEPLSIIVPAYNEEPVIITSINSLLAMHYPEFEIILVNDGSTDGTLEKIISEFNCVKLQTPINPRLNHKEVKNLYISDNYPNLIVVDKINGGKADSLNAGINISGYPVVCSIDADSFLEQNALLRAVKSMIEDKEVIAAGGIIRVLNGCDIHNGIVTKMRLPEKLIESLQVIEYIRGFLPGRTAWNYLGSSLLIISGAFGLFRKEAIFAIDGFRDTVGEDIDLILRMHKYYLNNKIKYKILFIPEPMCFTQVPSDLSSLLQQRNRWHRGLIDSLDYNRKMIFNPRYGAIGMISLPYFFLIEALGPLIEFFGYITIFLSFILGYLSLEFTVMFMVVSFLWAIMINIASVLLDNQFHRSYKNLRDILSLFMYGIFEMFGYRQLIVFERVLASFAFGQKGWGHFKREKIINSGSYKALIRKKIKR